MKKKLFAVLVVVLIMLALVGNVNATDVGGIINTDTTWGLSESPYNITSTIQISKEATLTIKPGVVVSDGNIEVWGMLNAIGSQDSKISLNSVAISPGQSNYGNDGVSAINIQHAIINEGKPYWGAGYGSITLKDSIITNTDYLYIWYPQNDCYIERNIFLLKFLKNDHAAILSSTDIIELSLDLRGSGQTKLKSSSVEAFAINRRTSEKAK